MNKMKTTQIIILLLFGVLYSTQIQAQDSLFKQANENYAKKEYDGAIVCYRQLIDTGYQDAVLYYNLGNAYFKNEQLGTAILWYERACRFRVPPKEPIGKKAA
jgi:tetratricopeptide (TPR) repeat protein